MIRILAVVAVSICLLSCSGIILLRVAAFEPADAEQAAYDWSRRDRGIRLTTPDYQLTLQQPDYSWVAKASFGGWFSVAFDLEESGAVPEGIQVVSASISPVRAKHERGVVLEDKYPLQLADVFREEYNQFRKDHRGEGRASWELRFFPDDVVIDAREGELTTHIPFRPRRIALELVVRNSSTGEIQTLSFILRERGLFAR